MIASKKEYKEYYITDLKCTGIYPATLRRCIKDRRIRFYKMLRKTEYYTNCRKDMLGCLWAKFLRFRYQQMCDKYAWTIPINVFGKGLHLVHAGPVVVTSSAKIGDYARVHVGVNIGRAYAKGKAGAPVIGNRCYMGPGCKIFGPVVIGDNMAIGANAVVNSSFEMGECTIAGVPAKKISNNTSALYILPENIGGGYKERAFMYLMCNYVYALSI